MPERLIVEGRILEFALHLTPLSVRRPFVLTLDVYRIWRRDDDADDAGWDTVPIAAAGWERFPQFAGESVLAAPGLKPGDLVRLKAHVDEGRRVVDELSVLSVARARWPLPSLATTPTRDRAVRRHTSW